MNNRERVLATLNHEQPDKIPYNIGFTKKSHAKMVEFYKDPDFVDIHLINSENLIDSYFFLHN